MQQKISLNKTRHVEFKNKVDEQSEKVKLISIKGLGLTKDLINEYVFLMVQNMFL